MSFDSVDLFKSDIFYGKVSLVAMEIFNCIYKRTAHFYC